MMVEASYDKIREYEPKMRDSREEDFEHALESMKPATTENMVRKYEKWNERFGAL